MCYSIKAGSIDHIGDLLVTFQIIQILHIEIPRFVIARIALQRLLKKLISFHVVSALAIEFGTRDLRRSAAEELHTECDSEDSKRNAREMLHRDRVNLAKACCETANNRIANGSESPCNVGIPQKYVKSAVLL